MNHNPTIDILLATYNGGRYLAEQIQSLLDQTYTRWRLIIRDDGSSDDTLSVVHQYRERYPDKITLIEDGEGNLGPCRNFARLLEHADADYTMFCDQDDVWLPTKIALTLEKMSELIAKYGKDVPLLVYTEMKVVDENLSLISDSYWKHQAFNPESGRRLNRLLVGNVIIGCTMMFNRTLRELSLPFPREALMHDWWLGLVAVVLGKSDYLREPTTYYRQHKSNVVGANWHLTIPAVMVLAFSLRKHKDHLLRTQEQAAALAERYGHLLNKMDLEKVLVYSQLKDQSCIKKRYFILKYHFLWAGYLRNTAMFVLI